MAQAKPKTAARTGRKAPARRPAKTPTRRKPPAKDLHDLGARVVSVFGSLEPRVMVELPAKLAAELFSKTALGDAKRAHPIDAVERDLNALRARDERLADSALAATALQLAYELADPYNSATSKSMCAKVLIDTMERLRELAPPERERDGIDSIRDDLRARREQHSRSAATADPAGS